jgi:hypothetical protein
MATIETIEYTFTSSDGKSLILSYNPVGNILVKAEIQINGSRFNWCTVEDFEDFTNNVISMINIIHSPSGSGSGYTPGSAGTAGSDAIID